MVPMVKLLHSKQVRNPRCVTSVCWPYPVVSRARGCLPREGVYLRGCLPRGSAKWICQGGVYPSMQWERHPPPVNRITDRYKNITLPQTSFAGCNKWSNLKYHTKQLEVKNQKLTGIFHLTSLVTIVSAIMGNSILQCSFVWLRPDTETEAELWMPFTAKHIVTQTTCSVSRIFLSKKMCHSWSTIINMNDEA